MGKWYDHLVASGSTAEEAKALDSPAAEKAFLAIAGERDTFKKNFEDSETNLKNYEDSVQNWYKDSSAKLTQAQNDVIAARAEEARHKAALEAAQKQGLLDVAKDLGWTPDPPKKELTGDEKYISREDFGRLMGEAGGTFARMSDMQTEYSRLFPGQNLNMSQELAESKAKGAANVFDYVEKKYNLSTVRAAAAEKARQDEIAKYRAEGRKEAETEFASKMGNPFTRPGVPSQKPIFQTRNNDAVREGKQPWDQVDGKLHEDRTAKAIAKYNERNFGTN